MSGSACPRSRLAHVAIVALMSACSVPSWGAVPRAPSVDPRLRAVIYSPDEVYRLPGYIGYEIDLQFAVGERFVGLGSGDVDGLSFAAQANHLFIKPRAANVRTNLTVLTTLRTYHFDYVTVHAEPGVEHADVIYALRFLYPGIGAAGNPVSVPARASVASLLAEAPARRSRNRNYWYCGRPELRPIAAWDDGVQTHVRFARQAELPALFVLNDDGSEALVDYHVEGDELVAHRLAHRFILRRGALVGCIVNRSYQGTGAELPSGTVSPQVQRALRRGEGR